jgi:hypothetical protein
MNNKRKRKSQKPCGNQLKQRKIEEEKCLCRDPVSAILRDLAALIPDLNDMIVEYLFYNPFAQPCIIKPLQCYVHTRKPNEPARSFMATPRGNLIILTHQPDTRINSPLGLKTNTQLRRKLPSEIRKSLKIYEFTGFMSGTVMRPIFSETSQENEYFSASCGTWEHFLMLKEENKTVVRPSSISGLRDPIQPPKTTWGLPRIYIEQRMFSFSDEGLVSLARKNKSSQSVIHASQVLMDSCEHPPHTIFVNDNVRKNIIELQIGFCALSSSLRSQNWFSNELIVARNPNKILARTCGGYYCSFLNPQKNKENDNLFRIVPYDVETKSQMLGRSPPNKTVNKASTNNKTNKKEEDRMSEFEEDEIESNDHELGFSNVHPEVWIQCHSPLSNQIPCVCKKCRGQTLRFPLSNAAERPLIFPLPHQRQFLFVDETKLSFTLFSVQERQ